MNQDIPQYIHGALERLNGQHRPVTRDDVKQFTEMLRHAILDGDLSNIDAERTLASVSCKPYYLPGDAFKHTRIEYRRRRVENADGGIRRRTIGFHIEGLAPKDATRFVYDIGRELDPVNGSTEVFSYYLPKTPHGEPSRATSAIKTMLRENILEMHDLVSFGEVEPANLFKNVAQFVAVCHPTEPFVLNKATATRPAHYFAPEYLAFTNRFPLQYLVMGLLNTDIAYKRADIDERYDMLEDTLACVPIRVVVETDGSLTLRHLDIGKLRVAKHAGVTITTDVIETLYPVKTTLGGGATRANHLARWLEFV